MLRLIRRIASAGEAREADDAELLRRFAAERDEAAFAELLRRHGPMVLGVVRRVLRRDADAEDAFQATFLVLARRAASVGRPQLLGNWLYGVAYRTALRARPGLARRAGREVEMRDVPASESPPEAERAELRAALDDEIARLPERVRLPFVLCHVQGKTNEEAARLIGVPKGTVLSRLARARERLRRRLERRGLAPAAVAGAVVSPALAQAALNVAARPGSAPPPVIALANGVRPMELSFKTLTAAVIAASLLGSGLVAHRLMTGDADDARREKIVTTALGGETGLARPEWSEVVGGLEGRILPTFRREVNGTPILGLTLELRNISTGSLALMNDPERVTVEILDADGKPVRQSGLPRSGPVPNPTWAVIPRDAYLGFALDSLTVGIPKDKGALLALTNADWALGPGRYTIRATLSVAAPKVNDVVPEKPWSGELKLPAVEVTVGGEASVGPRQ